MPVFAPVVRLGHEQVVFGSDPACGYRGIIALHSTALGPAVGGIRLWRYDDEQAALEDVLRLSRGMTYKNAMAGLPLGGGKSVVLAGGGDREAALLAHARVIESLGGRYVGAEDVGTTPADMERMRAVTAHVAGLASGAGDPSPFTALGVFRAMEAAATHRWGARSLEGRTVALQGCGNVGRELARLLHHAGASLVLGDVDAARARAVADETGGRTVDPAEIHAQEADVFAPCALGGILNDRTVPALRVDIVCGGANNQLLEAEDGEALRGRGILYVPDYVANAGGVLSGSMDILDWSRDQADAAIDATYERVLDVLARAERDGVAPNVAADAMAEERLGAAGRAAPAG